MGAEFDKFHEKRIPNINMLITVIVMDNQFLVKISQKGSVFVSHIKSVQLKSEKNGKNYLITAVEIYFFNKISQ